MLSSHPWDCDIGAVIIAPRIDSIVGEESECQDAGRRKSCHDLTEAAIRG